MSKQLPDSLKALSDNFPHRGLKRGELSFIGSPSPIGGSNPSRILSEWLRNQAKLVKSNNM